MRSRRLGLGLMAGVLLCGCPAEVQSDAAVCRPFDDDVYGCSDTKVCAFMYKPQGAGITQCLPFCFDTICPEHYHCTGGVGASDGNLVNDGVCFEGDGFRGPAHDDD